MVYLIVWAFMAIVGWQIGNSKGRPTEGFFAGLLLGIFGWIFIAARKSKVKCPVCSLWLEKGVSFCSRCGTKFNRELAAQGYLKKEEA